MFGQVKHEFVYNVKLNSLLSTYSIKQYHNNREDSCKVSFILSNTDNERIPYVRITITDDISNFQFLSSFEGELSIVLNSGSYSCSIESPGFTELRVDSLYFEENSEITLAVDLGWSNKLKHGRLFSSRELSDIEFEQIIKDLSLHEESKLIKNKTCYMIWEL